MVFMDLPVSILSKKKDIMWTCIKRMSFIGIDITGGYNSSILIVINKHTIFLVLRI